MKSKLALVLAALTLSQLTTLAQPGGPGTMAGGGPNFSGSMSRLFGENKAFTATLELIAKDGRAGDTTLPGVLSFDNGKSRLEMDMSKMKNSKMPPGATEQLKALGMDAMIVIARPDKKVNYMVYPNLKAFAEMPAPETEPTEVVSQYKVEKTELGKEKVAGYDCVKNKVTVTDAKNKTQESTVWNATALNDFPVRIELTENNTKLTLNFSEVKLTKPEAAVFETSKEMTKYDNVTSLIQGEAMKKIGNPGGTPIPAR